MRAHLNDLKWAPHSQASSVEDVRMTAITMLQVNVDNLRSELPPATRVKSTYAEDICLMQQKIILAKRKSKQAEKERVMKDLNEVDQNELNVQVAAIESARQEEYKKLTMEASERGVVSTPGVSNEWGSSSAAGLFAEEVVTTTNPEGEDVKKINWKQVLMQYKERAQKLREWEQKVELFLKEKKEREAKEQEKGGEEGQGSAREGKEGGQRGTKEHQARKKEGHKGEAIGDTHDRGI